MAIEAGLGQGWRRQHCGWHGGGDDRGGASPGGGGGSSADSRILGRVWVSC